MLGRYYPTVLTLATGDLLAVSGPGSGPNPPPSIFHRTPSVYDPKTNSWTTLDRSTHCAYLGTDCSGALPPASSLFLYWYAQIYGAPDGRAIYVGGPQAASGLGPTILKVDHAWALDSMSPPNPGSTTSRWTQATVNKGVSSVASFIQLRTSAGQPTWHVMKLGGADESGGATDCNPYDLRLDGSTQSWQAQPAPFNNYASTDYQATSYAVTLPNGKIMVVGGPAVPELYDPNPPVAVWQTLASKPTPPGWNSWHSIAALLPDGRVLLVGGQPGSIILNTGYIYNPPYLYRNCDSSGNCEFLDRNHAARPVIANVPPLVATGSVFDAAVTYGQGATDLNSTCFIRPGSPTHSQDPDQRFVGLEWTPSLNGPGTPPPYWLTITAPASAEEAPPGDYMFFVINNQGVPSVAKFVRVWGIVETSVQVAVTAATCAGIQFEITWRTSAETSPGAVDVVEMYPPDGKDPSVASALPPNGNDRRWHRVLVFGDDCQVGTWTVVVRSQRDGTESISQVSKSVTSCPFCGPCNPPCQLE